MKTQTHTPTPYLTLDEDDRRKLVKIGFTDEGSSYIVRAVNNFDAILSLLKEAKEMIASKDTLSRAEDNWLNTALQAIAKAEGK